MDTQTVITIITGALSFVTMVVVMLVGYIFVSTTDELKKSVNKSHERIDNHIHDNEEKFSQLAKDFVSHTYFDTFKESCKRIHEV